ncbi:MAG: glutamate racemase [Bacteroidia bacterium]|nr:glutamate racemase [Bacteroidia bacterium]
MGIFDSGVGGLTVWKEVIKLLPNESIIYYADNANCPYGPRPQEEIIKLSVEIVDFLLQKKCKLIIVACNTVTGAAIDFLREQYQVPFVGMEPAVKPAALRTKTGRIGILATEGTFGGRHYKETSRRFGGDKELIIRTGTGLVELAEQGDINSIRAEKLLKKYIQPMIDANVDYIVLGCTHYPLFRPLIEKLILNKIHILDASEPVARRTVSILSEYNLLNTAGEPNYVFYSTGKIDVLKKTVQNMNFNLNYSCVFTNMFSTPTP